MMRIFKKLNGFGTSIFPIIGLIVLSYLLVHLQEFTVKFVKPLKGSSIKIAEPAIFKSAALWYEANGARNVTAKDLLFYGNLWA